MPPVPGASLLIRRDRARRYASAAAAAGFEAARFEAAWRWLGARLGARALGASPVASAVLEVLSLVSASSAGAAVWARMTILRVSLAVSEWWLDAAVTGFRGWVTESACSGLTHARPVPVQVLFRMRARASQARSVPVIPGQEEAAAAAGRLSQLGVVTAGIWVPGAPVPLVLQDRPEQVLPVRRATRGLE